MYCLLTFLDVQLRKRGWKQTLIWKVKFKIQELSRIIKAKWFQKVSDNSVLLIMNNFLIQYPGYTIEYTNVWIFAEYLNANIWYSLNIWLRLIYGQTFASQIIFITFNTFQFFSIRIIWDDANFFFSSLQVQFQKLNRLNSPHREQSIKHVSGFGLAEYEGGNKKSQNCREYFVLEIYYRFSSVCWSEFSF